jgi:hypothetical protein
MERDAAPGGEPEPGGATAATYAFVEDVAASWERYARVASALSGPPPEGLIVHAAGPTDEGFRIIAVWESEEAWQRFLADRLGGVGDADADLPPVVRPLRPAHVVRGARDGGRPETLRD